MPALDDLHDFDVANADVSLWVFKKSAQTGTTPAPRFKGRWVETTDALDNALKDTLVAERNRIAEVIDYSLLAQNNEASALSIDTIETYAGLIVQEVAAEVQNKKVTKLKDIRNSGFYVVKFVKGDTVIHAVKKVDASWGTKRASNIISAIFADEQLTIDAAPSFDLAKSVDFFIVGDTILVAQKGKFESVLSYKQAHQSDFAELQADADFVAIFTDMAAIVAYVGENKIQLRRASAIHEKGHYRNAGFMTNLRQHHATYGLTIQFDGTGRITPTPETCRDIFQALLDHRLSSAFSQIVYDVPDAVAV